MTALAPIAVCAVSNRQRLAPQARTIGDELAALEAWCTDLAAAGVDAIQLREADLPAAALRTLAERVVHRAGGGVTRVFVNDRVDVAIAAGAAGVHLPSRGLSPALVRSLRADLVIGASVHAGDRADASRQSDYVIFGAVFPTRSKPGRDAAGLQALRAFAAAAACPVLAIGGVTPDRAADVIAAGASGVAAIGVFLPPGSEPAAMGPDAVQAFRGAMGK